MASAKMKRKKFRKTVSGKTAVRKAKKKTGKHYCTLCASILHGMPHGVAKAKLARMSKTEKKPTGIFAGVLCSKCSRRAIDEAIIAGQSSKGIESSDLSFRKFAKQALELMK